MYFSSHRNGDNLDRLTSASQTGNSLSFAYDGLGRTVMATAPNGSICLEWDLAGRRTKTIYPTSNCTDGNDFFVSYENYLGR